MSTTVDDILRELAGISFSEDADLDPVHRDKPAPDDILPETADDVFESAAETEPEETDAASAQETNGAHFPASEKRRAPSVTETLTAVWALLEEPDGGTERAVSPDLEEAGPIPAPEKSEPESKQTRPAAAPEKKRPESAGKSRKEKPAKSGRALRMRKEPKAAPKVSQAVSEQRPKPKAQRAETAVGEKNSGGTYTRVVRVTLQELAGEDTAQLRSKREKIFSEDAHRQTTRRFSSRVEPSLREEKLQGGASLRKVTRKASSSESIEDQQYPEVKKRAVDMDTETQQTLPEAETGTERAAQTADEIIAGLMEADTAAPSGEENSSRSLHIDVEEIRSASPEPEEIPAEPSDEEEQATRPIDLPGAASEQELQTIEQIENEPAPEMSREQMKKLKKQQQEGIENRRRQKKERAASDSQTMQPPEEVNTGETASGFAPCFQKLAWANSAAEISSWRKALRDVAGPSMGLGVLLSFLAAVVLALSLLVEMSDLVNGGIFLWIICGLGLIAGISSWNVLWSGIKSFFRFQENRDIMPTVLYLMTMVQAVILALNPAAVAQPYVHCYLPVGLFLLACSFFSRWVTASTALRNLRLLHSGGSKYYLHMVRDSRLATEMTRGVVEGPAFVAVNRRTESVSDFMKLSFSADESDRMSRNLSWIGLMAALLSLGFSMLFTWDLQMGLTLMTAVCCLFSPVLALFLLCYPMRKVSRFMERAGGVVVSEKVLSRYSLTNSAVLDAGDIFPQGFVTLCGMKTFGDARVDEVIIQTASMVIGSRSILTSIFEGVVGKEKDLLRQVDDRTYEDGKGLAGFIGGQQIFLGSRSLLESHGIRMSLDEHRKWTSGVGCACVYLAVAGELCAVFMIRLQTSVRSEEAVQIFADNGICLSVRTVDSFLTPRLLGRLFKVNPDRIKILPNRLSPYVDRLCGKVRVKQAVAVNDGSISGFAGCAASAKRLAFMQGLNRVLMILSIVLGMLMLLMLTLLGSLSSVTPLVMMGYVCFWPILGWLLQKLIRI